MFLKKLHITLLGLTLLAITPTTKPSEQPIDTELHILLETGPLNKQITCITKNNILQPNSKGKTPLQILTARAHTIESFLRTGDRDAQQYLKLFAITYCQLFAAGAYAIIDNDTAKFIHNFFHDLIPMIVAYNPNAQALFDKLELEKEIRKREIAGQKD